MKTIFAIKTLKQISVDDEDYERLNKYLWHDDGHNIYRFYAENYGVKWKSFYVSIANEIHNTRNILYDHIDRNYLNNLKSNLRIATKAHNNRNRNKSKYFNNRYKGVSRCKNNRTNPFRAKIDFDGKQIHLGYYSTWKDAARAYDEKAIELFGEFVATNF